MSKRLSRGADSVVLTDRDSLGSYVPCCVARWPSQPYSEYSALASCHACNLLTGSDGERLFILPDEQAPSGW